MKKAFVLFILIIFGLARAATDHLIFTEIAITPSDGEYIQIYNPTTQAVDLSNYYLTDAIDTVNGKFYYNLPSGLNYHSGLSSDFTARFPDGFALAAGATATITVDSTRYRDYYGVAADLAIKNNFRSAIDGEATIGGAPYYLDNIQESLILFYWDGTSAIVKDVDYFVWGSRLNCVDKTGIAGYNDDTAIDQQQYLSAHVVDEKFQRISDEGDEISSGGNGLTGHDETSEPLTETWQIVAVANTKPQLEQPYYSPQSPTTEDAITIYCNVTDDSELDSVILVYQLADDWLTANMTKVGGLYQVTIGPFSSPGTLTYYIRAVDDTGLENSTNINQLDIDEPQQSVTIQSIRDNWDEWEGQTVTLQGVVSIGSNILRTDRTSAYMQDQSGRGLNLFDYSTSDLVRGDSIEITGMLEEYSGVIELTNWTDSYSVLATGIAIPNVQEMTIQALISDPYYWEGSFVRIHGTVAERADDVGGGTNLIIEDVTGRTTVRIWNTTNVLFNSIGELVNPEVDSLLQVGNLVSIGGVAGIYQDAAQLLLGYAWDISSYLPGESGTEQIALAVAPYPFVPQLGEQINYRYEYPSNCRVILRVYDLSGRYITTLLDEFHSMSWQNEGHWDGRDELNQLVSPGTYLFHLEATNRNTGVSKTKVAPVVIGVKF